MEKKEDTRSKKGKTRDVKKKKSKKKQETTDDETDENEEVGTTMTGQGKNKSKDGKRKKRSKTASSTSEDEDENMLNNWLEDVKQEHERRDNKNKQETSSTDDSDEESDVRKMVDNRVTTYSLLLLSFQHKKEYRKDFYERLSSSELSAALQPMREDEMKMLNNLLKERKGVTKERVRREQKGKGRKKKR